MVTLKTINTKHEILIIDNRFMVNDIAYYDETDGRQGMTGIRTVKLFISRSARDTDILLRSYSGWDVRVTIRPDEELNGVTFKDDREKFINRLYLIMCSYLTRDKKLIVVVTKEGRLVLNGDYLFEMDVKFS